MTQITIDELTQIADDFLRENYGMALEIPIKRNNRLRTAIGRFLITIYGRKPLAIELSGDLMEYGARDVIIDTLYHELVHYALFVRKEPSNDGDEHFENELRRLGVSSTRTNNVGKHYVMKCDGCGKTWETAVKRVKDSPQRYQSKCCRSSIAHIDVRIYDGTEAV